GLPRAVVGERGPPPGRVLSLVLSDLLDVRRQRHRERRFGAEERRHFLLRLWILFLLLLLVLLLGGGLVALRREAAREQAPGEQEREGEESVRAQRPRRVRGTSRVLCTG